MDDNEEIPLGEYKDERPYATIEDNDEKLLSGISWDVPTSFNKYQILLFARNVALPNFLLIV